MPETKITVAAILGMEPATGALRVRVRDPENNVYALDLTGPVLGGLTVALNSQAGRFQGGIGQPMTLTASRAFTISDGRVGLQLTLDNSLQLPVLFPKEALPILRKAIDELERLSKQAPNTPPKN